MAEKATTESDLAILLVVSRIPRGRVATYGQVAELAGLPGRARLVGRLLGRLPRGSRIPWHRVVNAAGRSSLPGADGDRQCRLLAAEQVELRAGRVSLAQYRWIPTINAPRRHWP